MIGDFADFVSRLKLTPAGVVRGVAADPQKAAESLARPRLIPEPDHREGIPPEQALTEALFDSHGHKLAELLTGRESSQNSQGWRVAANKPLPYRYVHIMFGIEWYSIGRGVYWLGSSCLFLVLPPSCSGRGSEHVHLSTLLMWLAKSFLYGQRKDHSNQVPVQGPDEVECMADGIANHAFAYDSDPTRWERTREEVAQTAGVESEKFAKIAIGLAAMDAMNKDVPLT